MAVNEYIRWPAEGGGGGAGDVVGPSSSTNNAIARWDGSTGKLLEDSVVILGDTGDITGVTDLTMSGDLLVSGNITSETALLLQDPGGTDSVTIQAPTLSAPWTLTLPVDEGTNGYVLSTDGNGVTSWISVGGVFPMFTDKEILFGDGTTTPVQSADLTFDSGLSLLTVTGDASITNDLAVGNDFSVTGTTTLDTALSGIAHLSSGVVSASLIVDADVSNSAAIAYSKLDLTGSIVNADISNSAGIAYSKLNLANSIVNADIAVGAAITFAKLQALASGNILVGNGSNVATSVAMSGDVTISNAGVTAIGANKVTDAQLRQSAALSVVGNASNSTANVADISAGTDGNILRRSGTAIGFGSINLAASGAVGSSVLPIANGGTNNGSLSVAAGAAYYADGSKLVALAPGSSGQVYTSGGAGAPTWTTPLTNPMDSAGDMIYGGSAGVPTKLDNGTPGQFLIANGAAAPVWTSPSSAFYPPIVQVFNSTGANTFNSSVWFNIASGSATAGATYTNNSVTFTVLETVSSATRISMSGNGVPTTSGTLTKASGTGDSTLTFSSAAIPIYREVEAVGGGGGGGGGGNSGGSSGGAGGNSTVASTLIVANGGAGGIVGSSTSLGGAGGTASVGTGAYGFAVNGSGGGSGTAANGSTATYGTGGIGGPSAFGGAGRPGAVTNAALNAATNSGSGGGGGGYNNINSAGGGGGGGSGGYVKAMIPVISTYTYSLNVGTGGSAGSAAGANGVAGSTGGEGRIIFVDKFQ